VWSAGTGLHRVTAVVSDDPVLEDVLVGAYSRFVLVGADGVRLHEEVLYAGGWLPESGRFRRLANLGVLGGILDRALTDGTPAAPLVQRRLAAAWPQAEGGLIASIDARTADRRASLENKLAARQEDERRRIITNFERFGATLRDALTRGDAEEGTLFSPLEAEKSDKELAQYRRDRQSWQDRLAHLEEERDRELDKVTARYRDEKSHTFPVAVIFVVPTREATR
jgi:hypothetical protein